MQAPQLACTQCGGSFGLVQLAPLVTCPYCAQRQQVSADLLERMAAYRRAVDGRLQEISVQDQHVAAADNFMASYASRGGAGAIYALVVGGPLFAIGAVFVLQQTNVFPKSPVAVAGYVVAVALVVTLLARVVFGIKASDTETVKIGAVAVACPECGASASLPVGDAVAVCRFCDAQLVATAVAVERGVDAAEVARRQAAFQRFRKEREVMLHVNRPGKAMNAFALGSIVLGIGGMVFVGFRDGGDVAGWLTLALGAVSIATIATLIVRGALREKQRLHGFRDMAQQMRGRLNFGVPAMVAWLNEHWPSSYPPQYLYAHAHLIEVNTGYPTLIALNDKRAEAFVAASVSVKSGSAEANREKKWLRYLGFVVKVTDAGAWIEASPELLKRLGQDVQVYRLFVPAVLHASRMLRALNARRVG